MSENMGFADESGDRENFTIIPNYIRNHSTAIDQSLYFNMKSYAGEHGECFVSEKTLMKKMSIGRKALKKSITYLLGHKWITLKGYRMVKTAGGEQYIKVYAVNNIWKLNSDYFHQRGSQKNTPSQKNTKGCPKEHKGVAERAPNKIYMNKIDEEEDFIEPIAEETYKKVEAALGKQLNRSGRKA